MNLNLPNEINEFVKGLVSQGRFDSEEAAVVEGIRLLMSREQLHGEIQKGIDQLDNGECFDEKPYSPKSMRRSTRSNRHSKEAEFMPSLRYSAEAPSRYVTTSNRKQ